VYGPVCTVVWEGEGCEAFPYPDVITITVKSATRREAEGKRKTAPPSKLAQNSERLSLQSTAKLPKQCIAYRCFQLDYLW
jgi:hypothetical protein